MNKIFKLLLSLMLVVFVFNCSSDDGGNQEEKEEEINSDYLYFISGKLNGEDFFYGQRSDATILNYDLSNSIPLEGATCAYARDASVDAGISYGASISSGLEEDDITPNISIDFIRFYLCSNSQSSDEVFNSLFSVGNYDFAIDESQYSITEPAQVSISYQPANEYKVYESFTGNQENTNSYFKITATESNNFFGYGQTVEGDFSVKLTNIDDNSDVLEITEGRYKISLAK